MPEIQRFTMEHLATILDELERNAQVFQAILADLPQEMVVWRPAPDKWNILEIVCHLRDEELEDFRRRVQQTLENPSIAPPAIDPESWVLARDYAGQNYQTVLKSLDEARRESIAWLRTLDHPQWDNAWNHPKAGPLKASFFLQNWLAHDYLHIKQITQRKFSYLQYISAHSLDYAGTW